MKSFRENICEIKPGLAIIDTLTYTSGRNLNDADQVMKLMTPIRDIAQSTKTTIVDRYGNSRQV